ncbi:hypothetical protein ACP26L_35980 (plasmid) [Paenibacillus sp. S-38]|uniref:hypothetical protein n=1 Tax=Paenibacillus sp. S-38 TaxID=3416710 RepID=UPI003CFB2130
MEAPAKKTIVIPDRNHHEGLFFLSLDVPHTCIHCGGPRGRLEWGKIWDRGYLRVNVWKNRCGHVEQYDELRRHYQEEIKMHEGTRAYLLMAIIHTMMEMSQGMNVDIEELKRSLTLAGIDGEKLLGDMPLVKAIQIVCREFGELDLSEKTLLEMVKKSAEDYELGS